ncbi:MAG: hypothetical protein HWE23_09615 [Rhodobacteraceae bacterium]|nr:hypothetical protein [Paracoccaceae bacterium]
MPTDLWGTLDSDGNVLAAGSTKFTSVKQSSGTYLLTFSPPLTTIPALTGSLCGVNANPANQGGLVFSQVSKDSATVITLDDEGENSDTGFAFIGMSGT